MTLRESLIGYPVDSGITADQTHQFAIDANRFEIRLELQDSAAPNSAAGEFVLDHIQLDGTWPQVARKGLMGHSPGLIGLAAGAQLEHLAQQDQRDDHRGRLEVDGHGARRRAEGVGEDSGGDGRRDAVAVRGAGAEGDQREHVELARDDRAPAPYEERQPAPEDDGRREDELDPLERLRSEPLGEIEARQHHSSMLDSEAEHPGRCLCLRCCSSSVYPWWSPLAATTAPFHCDALCELPELVSGPRVERDALGAGRRQSFGSR